MKPRPWFPLLLAVCLLVAWLPSPAQAEEPFFDPARFKLDNGLEVWVQPRPRTPAVALRLVVRVGSRYENVDNNGISHFVEHMLFTGTERWDEAEVAAAIDQLGGDSNGGTGLETTLYWVDVGRDYLPQAMDWMAQLVAHPSLAAEEVDDERQVIMQEMGGDLGPIFYLMDRLGFGYDLDGAIWSALFPESSLALPVIGTKTSLSAVQHADLLDYYHTYYTPDNMLLVVVGDVAPDQVRELAQAYLGHLSPAAEPVARPPAPAPASGPVTIRLRGPNFNDWATLTIGYRTVGDGHPDRYALEVAAQVLSFRLDESVRYERGLAYSLGAYHTTLTDVGYLEAWASAEGKYMVQIQPLIQAELERLRDEPIRADELARARQSLIGQLALWLETNGAQADQLANIALWLPADQAVPNDFAGIGHVTAADVQRVAQTYFQPEGRYTALYRPAVTLSGVAVGVGAILGLAVVVVFVRRWRRRRRAKALQQA
jgi:predicted Zn-dependent peptidase